MNDPMDSPVRSRPNRRELLLAASAPVLVGLAGGAALAQEGRRHGREPGLSPGLITRETDATNLEFPFSTLDGVFVPTESFYVRNHFAQPVVEASSWRAKIEGAVERPFELSYDDLRKMPSRTFPCLLECSGNGRVFLKPKQGGVQWELGAVGCAEWTGVPLAAVLERAGVRPNAVEVILEGIDKGTINDEPKSPGEIHFARSMSLAKARSEDVILAYKMNGKDLTPAHGFPVRALVPGWYGMCSVKWLGRIIVSEQPYQGYFQTMQYAYWRRTNGLPALTAITEMQVKSQIARPAPHEVVPAGKSYHVFGAAWSGEAPITGVELSSDGGKSWSPARLLGESIPHAWRLWDHEWRAPERPGRVVLMSRATDAAGRVQPADRDPDRRNTMISHTLPIEVEVR